MVKIESKKEDVYISLAEALFEKNKYYYDDNLKNKKINNRFFIFKNDKWESGDIIDIALLFTENFPNLGNIIIGKYYPLRKAFIKIGTKKGKLFK